MTTDLFAEFLRVRDVLLTATRDEEAEAKVTDGTLTLTFPGAFLPYWRITSQNYALGPTRYADWEGEDFAEVLARFRADVDVWIAEEKRRQHERAQARRKP